MKKKNKILHVVDSFFPAKEFGGPILSTKALCDYVISDEDYFLTVLSNNKLRPHSKLALNKNSDEFIYATKTYNIRWVNHTKWYSDFVFIYKLFNYISKNDIIHLTGMFNACSFYTILITFLLNKKIVISPRGSIQALFEFSNVQKPKLKFIVLKIYSFFLSSKKSFWLGTTDVENYYSEKIKKLKSFICINPVDLPSVNINIKKRKKFTICFISRLSQKKGVKKFLSITSKLPKDKFEILIAGSAENEEIYQTVIKYTLLHNNITYCGVVDGDKKSEFFLKSDLFLFPSDSENFGIVIAEALSHGCSVLTTVKSPWEKHYSQGVLELFELSDSDYLIVDKIFDIFKLRKENNSIKSKCVSIIKKNYTFDSMFDQIKFVYKDVMKVI